MDFLGLGPLEVVVILVVALIALGPQRIVEVASNLGKAIREFRKTTSQLADELTQEFSTEEPKTPPKRPALSPPPGTRSREGISQRSQALTPGFSADGSDQAHGGVPPALERNTHTQAQPHDAAPHQPAETER